MGVPYLVVTRFNFANRRIQIFGPFETFSILQQFLAGQERPQDFVESLVFGAPPSGSFSPNTPVAVSQGQIIVVRYTGEMPSAIRPGQNTSLVLSYGPWDSISSGQAWVDSFPAQNSFLNVIGPILAPPPP